MNRSCEVFPVKKSVLIADDNAIFRRVIRHVFTSQEDFAVCGEAENGQEAIEKAQELHPDLIVMDLAMPVMGGIDAARVLGRLMPTVPMVVLSGYSDLFSERCSFGRCFRTNLKVGAHFCAAGQSPGVALPRRGLIVTFFHQGKPEVLRNVSYITKLAAPTPKPMSCPWPQVHRALPQELPM